MLNDAGIFTPKAEGGFYLFCDFNEFKGAFSAAGIKTGA